MANTNDCVTSSAADQSRTAPAEQPFVALSAEVSKVSTTATPLREAISSAYRLDEVSAVQNLLKQFQSNPALQSASQALAQQLVTNVRAKRSGASGVDALMHEFSLSSEEGIALMCLAEALLRIPDHQTADRLIANKISKGDWQRHLGTSPSLFVNAASWGLLVTGKLLHSASEDGLGSALTRLISKGGEPLIRKGVDLAMRMLGSQFVAGQTIDEALERSRTHEADGYRYSYDMLGEAAITTADADAYYLSYTAAIHAIGKASEQRGIHAGPGISVKLSALHPRYARAQRTRVMQELLPRLKQLVLLAKQYDIGINIDAEEADRLELSLDLMEALAADSELAAYDGLGYVVQAYQKRCPYVIDYLIDLARRSGMKFMVRLVKGAYWDTEIKRAQVDGLSGYPVYTRKAYTDLSYLVCAQKLLANSDVIYPQFATHNALTFATIYQQAQALRVRNYEFQCLHGMGETLYDQIVGSEHLNIPCRIYAPVGTHETLLAYLVRRLLENGANSSFVNQIVDDNISIPDLLQDPVALTAQFAGKPHPALPLPINLYGTERRNSSGIDLSDEHALRALSADLRTYGKQQWHARPLIGTVASDTTTAAATTITISNPANHQDVVGTVMHANKHEVEQALGNAMAGLTTWQAHTAEQRATILLRAADLFQEYAHEFIAIAVREAGKTLPNAISELREAIDFLRYYSAQAVASGTAQPLGLVACISPWNFPLAIFTGQLSAALAAGNVALVKPAEQTPLIAFRAVQLLHQAGVPESALLYLPGDGTTIGAQLVADKRIAAVVFTGSTQVARSINRKLGQRSISEDRDIPLIAETGGQNAMIVDSSALCEQVVHDVIHSAFDSAGQRCSALRVLCLQTDIAEQTLRMLKEAMQELQINNPDRLQTDIGPVIDKEAQEHLRAYIKQTADKRICELTLPATAESGTFVTPCIIEIGSITELKREVFGPVLHVLRYQREGLPQLVRDINATGFGLTLGIHSRIDETIDYVVRHAHVGNIYVNRNIVGAVVGVQPFGGEGLSGTGPKAGGPFYLKRLQHSDALTIEKTDDEDREEARHIETALAELLTWSIPHKEKTLSQLIVEYVRTSLAGKIMQLHGVTGEINTLRFSARGAVLCVAETTPALLNQLFAAYATGNQVVLLQGTALLVPSDFPAYLRAGITIIEHQHACKELRLALLERGQHKSDLRTALAEREGAIVPIVTTDFPYPVPLWRLVNERALCVNTTAAGGNASLMVIGA